MCTGIRTHGKTDMKVKILIFEEYVFHNDNFAILSNLLISKNHPFFENLVSFLDFDIQT